jgi:hypothetical protein
MSTQGAALGSRPGLAYVEHKQNIRPGCRGTPVSLWPVRVQDLQTVSIRLWNDWVDTYDQHRPTDRHYPRPLR